MYRHDIAVVGSGIGGSLVSALNKDKDIILFERDTNVGGCASTFTRYGYKFNAGATTFVGYEDNHVVKDIFEKIEYKPKIKKSHVAIRVVQGSKTIDRVKEFEEFVENIDEAYPNKNNRVFWKKIKDIDEKFWTLKNIYYSKHSFSELLKTSMFIKEMISMFGFSLLKSADSFIKETLGDISQEYRDFLDAGLLITVQTTSKEIPLLSLALGLAYPFHDVFYPIGGMGKLIEEILAEVDVHRKEEILSIDKKEGYFELETIKGNYQAKNVVLNTPLSQSARLFKNKEIQKYYESFDFNDQSAFVIYLKLKSKQEFLHHYQFILDEQIPNAISNSFFVSFSDRDDEVLSKDGYSITISTHTKALFWKKLSKSEYSHAKNTTSSFIIDKFLQYFDTIDKSDIIKSFSATSLTFNRYISRYNCGGKALKFSNILSASGVATPFDGLYNVGDTIFTGQGWPGVSLGAQLLNKELNAKFR